MKIDFRKKCFFCTFFYGRRKIRTENQIEEKPARDQVDKTIEKKDFKQISQKSCGQTETIFFCLFTHTVCFTNLGKLNLLTMV
jgi:hypothetical protein